MDKIYNYTWDDVEKDIRNQLGDNIDYLVENGHDPFVPGEYSFAIYAIYTAARSLYTIENKGFISKTKSLEWILDRDEFIKYHRLLKQCICLRNPLTEKDISTLNYRHHAYDIINLRLDFTASIVGSYLQNEGYNVLPLPAAERIDDERICATFSHKLGAHLSGLGWIGKSCLLVTPEHGPRARWVSILTDAPLEPTGKPMEEKCGDCELCVLVCPVDAFTNRTFYEDEPRELRQKVRKIL
ncbi:MAG: 4Fe-4S binding protein [bacterium]